MQYYKLQLGKKSINTIQEGSLMDNTLATLTILNVYSRGISTWNLPITTEI